MYNYGDLPKQFTEESTAKVAILPVPYDGTSTWIKGADKGPEALLEASANMELYDIETDSEVYKIGIYTAPAVRVNKSPEAMVEAVRKKAESFLEKEKLRSCRSYQLYIRNDYASGCMSTFRSAARARRWRLFSVLTDIPETIAISSNERLFP